MPISSDWPVPVFRKKRETDANFERVTRCVLQLHAIASAGAGEPQCPLAGQCHRDGPIPRTADRGLRNSNALRHGRSGKAGHRRSRPANANLHALRRTDSGHGVSGSPALGKHVERILCARELFATRRDGETADESGKQGTGVRRQGTGGRKQGAGSGEQGERHACGLKPQASSLKPLPQRADGGFCGGR